MKSYKLVLASSSAYRKALLEKLRLDFICVSPNIDETKIKKETPKKMALRLGIEKAKALIPAYPKHFIIGSDQVAVLKGRQLTKPGTRNNAIQQLQHCSGQSIKFHTSICVINSATNEIKSHVETTTVFFKNLTEQQIVRYIDLEMPYDCAGSFKAEGLGITLFTAIQGDDPNALIGLPLIKLIALLNYFGLEILSK